MARRHHFELLTGSHIGHVPMKEGGTQIVMHKPGDVISSEHRLDKKFVNKFKKITEEEFNNKKKALKGRVRDASALDVDDEDEGFEVADPKVSGEDNPAKPSDERRERAEAGGLKKKAKAGKDPSPFKGQAAAAPDGDDGQSGYDEAAPKASEESDEEKEEPDDDSEEQAEEEPKPKKKKKKKSV